MSERFSSQQQIDEFLQQPRLAILMYNGVRTGPTGVPVWLDWDGATVRMFAGRTSPKVKHLTADPNISVLVSNHVGEAEGWVAFDGRVAISNFAPDDWATLLDRMAPRYWDLSVPGYADQIKSWRAMPEAFVSLELSPDAIRSGA